MPSESGTPGPEGRRTASLRLRLGLGALLTGVLSLGLVGLALDAAYRASAESSLRQQMETWMYLVLAAVEVQPGGRLEQAGELGDPLLEQPDSGVTAHVVGASGRWTSPSALGETPPDLPAAAPGEQRFDTGGTAAIRFQYGIAWELDDGAVYPFTVSLLAERARLDGPVAAFRQGLWRSLALAAALMVLAQFAFASLGLRPLKRVAGDVAAIERGEAESLRGDYPVELQPLSRNLDRLLASEKANQAVYRNALDSLAHSLKTPLTVVQSSTAGGGNDDPAATADALADMQRLIATRLERAGAGTRRTLGSVTEVAPVAERLAATLRKVHSQELRNLSLNMDAGTRFHGEERDLLELLGNLLDNACKYGNGEVRLDAGVRDGACWMEVHNGGEAPDHEALQAWVARGARGDEHIEGHGLGLAIVAELVKAYGGSMRFKTSDLGGACVRLDFPVAP